jgi:protein involved in polysaccharide export with SLBB domain
VVFSCDHYTKHFFLLSVHRFLYHDTAKWFFGFAGNKDFWLMHSWFSIVVGRARALCAPAVAVVTAAVLSGCLHGGGGGGYVADDGYPPIVFGSAADNADAESTEYVGDAAPNENDDAAATGEKDSGENGTGESQADSPESDFKIQQIAFSPNGEPILRPGYILSISVMVGEKAEVRSEVQISTTCEVTLPLVGSVDCAGLTLAGLRGRLASSYGEYYHDPEVRAHFVVKSAASSPWGRVFVGGRVRREGWVVIPATRMLTVSEAIRQAGGFSTYARRDNIRVTRLDDKGKRKVFRVNLEEIARKGKTENDILLKHGDVVWVRETSI